MADRLDYYFRQRVTEAELDLGFAQLEQADHDLAADLGFVGVLANAVISQHAPVPDLTVDVSGPGAALDPQGQRIFFSALQRVSLAQDENGVSTAPSGAGLEKVVALFVRFERALSDPRVDGNSLTVFFRRDESFRFVVAQGGEAPAGEAIPPPLRSDAILLADITRTFEQTQILNANISTARRQDAFVAVGSPRSLRRGRTLEALVDLLSFYNAHATGTADRHAASAIDYAGGGPWADGTQNPSATVEAQLDKLIADLSATAGALRVGAGATASSPNSLADGSVKSQLDALLGFLNAHLKQAAGAHIASAISYAGGSAWADGAANPSTTVEAQLDKLISDLAGASGADKLGATVASRWADGTGLEASRVKTALEEIISALAASNGAPKVGAAGTAGSPHSLAAGSVKSQLDSLLHALNNHLNTASAAHAASAISYGGAGTWKDATAVSSANVEAAIDEVVSDLAADAGASRIGTAARSAWLGGRTNPAGVSLLAALDKIITDLGLQVGGDDGAMRVGAQASGNLPAGSVRSQLDALDATSVRTSVPNTFSALQTVNGAAGDTSGALATTAAPSVRKLLWEFAINANYKGRLYSSTKFLGSFELTLNARWDGVNWVRDSANPGLFAAKWSCHNYEWRLDVKSTAAVAFPDSTWDGFFRVEFPVSAPMNVTLTADGQLEASGPCDSYVGAQAQQSSNSNLGSGAPWKHQFPATPSSITFQTVSASNVASGPFAFAATRFGTGAYVGAGPASTTWFYAHVRAS